jgi:outer membrane protease
MTRLSRAVVMAAAVACAAGTVRAGAPFQFRAEVGPAVTGGDVTFRVGGYYEDAFGREPLPDTISELEWPREAVWLRAAGAARHRSGWEAHLAAAVAPPQDGGRITDTDYRFDDPSVVEIVGRADARFDGWECDGGVRYWFLERAAGAGHASLSAGFGCRVQKNEWEASDAIQEYPGADLAPDVFPGLAITYETTLLMPYAELAALARAGRIEADLRAGWSPSVGIDDADDHVLRTIRSEAETKGAGWLVDLDIRWRLSAAWFLSARGWAQACDADGSAWNEVYGDADAFAVAGEVWQTGQEIEVRTYGFALGFGGRF